MNAALKPNEQAALDVRLAQRRNDVWEILHNAKDREYRRDCLLEHIGDHMTAMLDQILENHQTDDEADNGRILSNAIASFASNLMTQRMAQELRDEYLPSWNSEVIP